MFTLIFNTIFIFIITIFHEADATTQPCVGVKGIGQGRSITIFHYYHISILLLYNLIITIMITTIIIINIIIIIIIIITPTTIPPLSIKLECQKQIKVFSTHTCSIFSPCMLPNMLHKKE